MNAVGVFDRVVACAALYDPGERRVVRDLAHLDQRTFTSDLVLLVRQASAILRH